MKLFYDKKGIVTHPVMLFLIGVAIGVILTILWSKGIISVAYPFCGP